MNHSSSNNQHPAPQATFNTESSTLAYAITRWSSRFENAQSRRTKDPNHSLMPHELNSTQLEHLMKQESGPLALGVWHILIQIATRCPQRGLLVTEDGPHTDTTIAQACHLSEGQIAQALNLLMSPAVGWLDIVECPRQVLVTGSFRSGRKGRPTKPEVIHIKGINEGPDFHIERLMTVVEHTPEGSTSPQFKAIEVLPYEFERLLNPKEEPVLEHKKQSSAHEDIALEHTPEATLWKIIHHWNQKDNLIKINMLSVYHWFRLIFLTRENPTLDQTITPAIDRLSRSVEVGRPAPTFESFIFKDKKKAA